jgi:hypothetical protein
MRKARQFAHIRAWADFYRAPLKCISSHQGALFTVLVLSDRLFE